MLRLSALLTAAAVVLGACGGGGAAPATSAPAAGGGQAGAVTVRSLAFGPQSLEVAAGTTVTWTNQDSVAHTTTSGRPGSPDAKWNSPLPASGGSFSFTFAQAGTYQYFCSIHTSMSGTVTVR